MNATVRVAGFLAAVAAAFGLALAAGHLVGPVGVAAAPGQAAGHGDDHSEGSAAEMGSEKVSAPGGLSVSENGYTLALADPVQPPGSDRRLAFVIEGPDGPVTGYDGRHDREMHLIAVRRDFTGFQHVHPSLAADGTWSTRLDLTPGSWRVFADFAPTDKEPLTLGADLTVPGSLAVSPEEPTSRVASVDGYTVRVAGDLRARDLATLRLRVERSGRPVTDLEPYLGAYGHLVALRSGDLAYLHVHPVESTGPAASGPDVTFGAEVPSSGTYHLYLDFKHDGVVRTARFVLDAARD